MSDDANSAEAASSGNQRDLLYREEGYAIQGAVFEVYREMGCGFVEPVYHECFKRELISRKIPFQSKPELQLRYKGSLLDQTFEPDFVCYDKIIVELKAIRELAPVHDAQLLNYLKITGFRLGLLVNFATHPHATIKRLVR